MTEFVSGRPRIGGWARSKALRDRQSVGLKPTCLASAPVAATSVPRGASETRRGGLPSVFSPQSTGAVGGSIVSPVPQQFPQAPRPIVPAVSSSMSSDALGQPSRATMVYDELGFHRQFLAEPPGSVAPAGAGAPPHG